MFKALAAIDKADNKGITALMTAVTYGKVACVEAFIDAGADVNKQTCKGETALIKASINGHSEILDLLIKKGADTNLASSARNLTCMELLL